MTYPIIIKLISPLSLYYICNVCIYSCFFSRNIRKLHCGFLVSLPKEERSQDEKNGSSRMGRNIAVFVFHAHRRQKKGVQSNGYCPPPPLLTTPQTLFPTYLYYAQFLMEYVPPTSRFLSQPLLGGFLCASLKMDDYE